MVMMTIEHEGVPSLAEAARLLGVDEADIDPKFGIVPIDPDHNLYSVRVAAEQAKSSVDRDGKYRGPFSDPKIAPMR